VKQLLERTSSHIFSNLSLYLFVFLIIFTIDRHGRWVTTKDEASGPFFDDVAEYYAVLPLTFLDSAQAATPETKQYLKRRTLGMAIMYSPFFMAGHLQAKLTATAPTGYSPPYQNWIHAGTLIYVLLALWLCRKVLLLYFSDLVVFLSLLSVFMGTNLFFYTYGSGEMPHSYLFFLYAAFISCCVSVLRRQDTKRMALAGLLGGLITLIRPSDATILLFPIVFRACSFSDLRERVNFIFSKGRPLLAGVTCFLLPWLIQLLYWKKTYGHFFYDGYGEEGFFFNDPQVLNFLFSFRKGWLVYTPIMVLALAGIVVAYFRRREFFLFSLLLFALNLFVLSCWWDWSYGGSFGCRALIQSYAFLFFPFAVFVEWCWARCSFNPLLQFASRTALCTALFLFIKLNLFQSWQYKFQIIHWNGMNKEAYRYVFLKESLSDEEFRVFHSKLTPPDYGKMLRGERD
jgi:hypothetical protein